MLNADILKVLWLELNSQFNGAYQSGEDTECGPWVTKMNLTTESMRFDFLGDDHEFRKWAGQRTFHQIRSFKYQVSYEDFEDGLRVLRRDIINNTISGASFSAKSLGLAAKRLAPRLCAEALDNGADSTSLCYDGQPFFDTEHPVGDGDDITLVSNFIGGSGSDGSGSGDGGAVSSPWYMMDLSRAIKPIISLEREAVRFYSFTNLEDPNVFNNKEFLFAADATHGAGYGLWQTCFRCEDTPTVQKILDIDFAMRDLRGDNKDENGRRKKLAIKPTHIVYGASQRVRMAQLQQPNISFTWTADPGSAPGATDTMKPNPLARTPYTFQEVSWLP